MQRYMYIQVFSGKSVKFNNLMSNHILKDIIIFSNILFPDFPRPLDFKVTQCGKEMVITWTAVPTDQPCPTTGYNIAIGNNTIIVPANQTIYTQPISDSECGSTIQINMSAINVAGAGNVTTINHNVVCTRECCTTKICFFMSMHYTMYIQLIPLNWDGQYSTTLKVIGCLYS